MLYVRCGNNEPLKNKVYFSPIIELNQLNFPKYTDGVDPAIPKFSVRYYNYAIAKWFEIYLKEKYRIAVNDPEQYERNSISAVYNKISSNCNGDKTEPACFFTDKEELKRIRQQAITDSKLPAYEPSICEVISL